MYGGGGLVAKSCPNFVTSWTVAHQVPLCIGFPRQEYWSGLPFPSPLEGYTLLTNPYGGEVVKAEDPQQTIAPAGNLVYASLEKPSVKTTESNPFGFLISWFDKLIA